MQRLVELLVIFALLPSCNASASPTAGQSSSVASVEVSSSKSDTPKDNLGNISAYAVNAPESVSHDVTKLASYLVAGAKTEKGKAFAIFAWVNAYGGTPHPDLGVTMTDCLGHAWLFKDLTTAVGIKSDIIGGCARDLSNTTGQIQYDTHSWNTVVIDGVEQFVECTWNPRETKGGSVVRVADPYYFLVSPDQFIYTHIPFDPQRQLLSTIKTQADLEKAPFPTAYYYENNLKMISHTSFYVDAPNGLAEVVIDNPKKVGLAAELWQNGTKLSSTYLRGEMKGDGHYHQYIAAPRPGIYVLRILTKSLQRASWLDLALSYRVNAYAASTR